jgi:hypothetical protein
VTIDLAEAEVAQPAALFLDGDEDVGGSVRALEELPQHLLARDRLAVLAPPLPDVLGHGVVEDLFQVRRGTGDVLAVDEAAAVGEHLVDLAVQRPLALVGQVVDGEAADDGVEGAGDGPPPGRLGQVGLDDGGARAEIRQLPAGLFEHRRREIEGDAGGVRERPQDGGQQQAVAGAQVEDAARRPRREAQQPQHHVQLPLAVGDDQGALAQEGVRHVVLLPDVGRHAGPPGSVGAQRRL